MRIFKKSVYFLFESGSLDSPGGPSSNRRYSITGVLRRRVIMNFTSKGPAEAKSTITLRRIHLIRRPYAKRRGRRETMFDCPLSKTVKILDQRSCSKRFWNEENWIRPTKIRQPYCGIAQAQRKEPKQRTSGSRSSLTNNQPHASRMIRN